ncbi:hypothetical protein I6F09_20755 [Bradyrhizobium sp. IC3195]|uniref:hypothetical protein n=1 Tax=Bradyrhizobium sp. IC3195 TaxID=2793804 RepID=UPI001CD63F4C|nr:hypothetical protein [Bradyrhizobium sp. IC3195]MCA1470322.1 hypothetical protein [Bradyrhizobium sp. IC3195]
MTQLEYVPQRPGCKDCEIASLATVTGAAYEEIAGVLGIAIDPTTKLPDLSKYPAGIDLLDVVYPLFRLGWSAAVVVTQEGFRKAEIGRFGPSSQQLKADLAGRRATIGYVDTDPAVGNHSLAWDGSIAIDCSTGERHSLDNVEIHNAVILTRLESPIRMSAS